MRAGGSFLRRLLNDWESPVTLMTAPAVPEIGMVPTEAVQRPYAPALPILSSSSCSTLLLEYGSTSYRPAYSRLKAPTCRDRKSTRLNSSHGYISYAVFCLKKKKKKSIRSM